MTTPDILHQMFKQDGPKYSLARCESCGAYTTRQRKNLVRIRAGKYDWRCPRCRRIPLRARLMRFIGRLL